MQSRRQRRHRAQAGTTLIELLVAISIIGLVLVLLVGAVSDGIIQAAMTKRNTAVTGAVEFELDKIGAAVYTTTPAGYSECFAVDTSAPPAQVGLGGICPAGTNLRADVTEANVEIGVQQWTVKVDTYPALAQVGQTVQVYKVNR
ncbi:MAG TPA: prepilin-type N-terminal cleavage/methylation domain-containing protein [Candidatus Dormibacteraeota bacterium]|nr:prepilin-type N-terminal cleavage/methylation domain-containing protein [Candidatus Dormibacteraeota bacterium]